MLWRLRLKLWRARLAYACARLNGRLVRITIDIGRWWSGQAPLDWSEIERNAAFVVDCVPKRERAAVYEQMARPGRN